MSIEEIAERFKRETANHEMKVLHDDGLYRHLLFTDQTPRHAWAYWFELITVPGSLIFRGDGDSFVFARTTDMFNFFRISSAHGINPHYWSEKLTSGGGQNGVMIYDQALFERTVRQYVAEAIRDGSAPRGIAREVRSEIFEWGEITFEVTARQALESFDFKGFRFSDTWEWNFRDYDWWFVWACHAIVWGIGQYDKAREQVAS